MWLIRYSYRPFIFVLVISLSLSRRDKACVIAVVEHPKVTDISLIVSPGRSMSITNNRPAGVNRFTFVLGV